MKNFLMFLYFCTPFGWAYALFLVFFWLVGGVIPESKGERMSDGMTALGSVGRVFRTPRQRGD